VTASEVPSGRGNSLVVAELDEVPRVDVRLARDPDVLVGFGVSHVSSLSGFAANEGSS
jgi:hypothetical protein